MLDALSPLGAWADGSERWVITTIAFSTNIRTMTSPVFSIKDPRCMGPDACDAYKAHAGAGTGAGVGAQINWTERVTLDR